MATNVKHGQMLKFAETVGAVVKQSASRASRVRWDNREVVPFCLSKENYQTLMWEVVLQYNSKTVHGWELVNVSEDTRGCSTPCQSIYHVNQKFFYRKIHFADGGTFVVERLGHKQNVGQHFYRMIWVEGAGISVITAPVLKLTVMTGEGFELGNDVMAGVLPPQVLRDWLVDNVHVGVSK